MTIRRMELADVARVAQIERQTFSQPWSENAFASAVCDENALFYVAACDSLEMAGPEETHRPLETIGEGTACGQQVVGYIGMYLSAPEGEITNVAVAEDFRGRGCGGALVSAMQQKARELGIKQIFLEVRDSNEAAIHVYTAAGFEEIGKRRDFYAFPREDARVMRWNDLC